jgi:hypothetical protein
MRYRSLMLAIALLLLSSSCSAQEWVDTGEEELQARTHADAELGQEEERYLVIVEEAGPQLELCQPLHLGLTADLGVYQVPDLPEPAPRSPFLDPVFGTCQVRVTDREHDPLNPEDRSPGLKNEYARVQSFNADDSLLLVRSIEGFWYVYDARSLQPLGEVPVYVEPRWDAQDPYLLYFTQEDRLMSYDLKAGELSLVHDFAPDLPDQELSAVWTRYEGSPSYDARLWGFLAQDENWETTALVVYDLERDQVLVRELSRTYSIDNATISPLGNYLLASFDDYCQEGELGNDASPCGFMVYDRELENGRGLLRIIGHYDALLDAGGREAVIYQDIDTDQISLLDLESGEVTPLLPIDFSHTGQGFHFSGRASELPGWALVSTYNGGHPNSFTWMDDSVFAIELKPGGRVVRLAHTHAIYNENMEKDYWAEPHASVNRDFTRVLFTSNWGRSGTEAVDLYLIALPAGWVDELP